MGQYRRDEGRSPVSWRRARWTYTSISLELRFEAVLSISNHCVTASTEYLVDAIF